MTSQVDNNKTFVTRYVPQTVDIWALGITVVIGGQYFSWNFGLLNGFGNFIVATAVIGFQYICLVLCTSEISSALPFAGGAYGLARCTLGFYLGFLVGCCESLEYIIYVALSVVTLGSMLTELFHTPSQYQPVYWVLFYASALVIQNQRYGGALFWRFIYAVAVISLIIVLIYSFGSFRFGDLSKNCHQSGPLFANGIYGFMQILPLPAWFFVGVESLPFTCDVVKDPRTSIGRGAISCILTLFVTAILVTASAAALPAQVDNPLASALFPLNQGFTTMFNISVQNAVWLSIPATYGTAFGFIYGYGKILCSMAKSKLLPDIFGINTNNTPFYAMCLGSTVSMAFCIWLYVVPSLAGTLFNLCILSGFVGYFSQCIGYISMRTKFQTLDRKFRSPLGIFGAVYTASVALLGVISIIFFQGNQYIPIVGFLSACAVFSVYYFTVSKHRQTFSPDEQKIMFVAHVVNFNSNKRAPRNNRGSNNNSNASSQSTAGKQSMSYSNNRKSTIRQSSQIVPIAAADEKQESFGSSESEVKLRTSFQGKNDDSQYKNALLSDGAQQYKPQQLAEENANNLWDIDDI